MIAEITAERGVLRLTMSSAWSGPGREQRWRRSRQDRGEDREVLGDVVGDRERREGAACDQELLSDFNDLDELRGVGVEVDRMSAGLARGLVAAFIATPTSAWARAGASLVPSPVIATIRPWSWCSLINASLASGGASARKSSTPYEIHDDTVRVWS